MEFVELTEERMNEAISLLYNKYRDGMNSYIEEDCLSEKAFRTYVTAELQERDAVVLTENEHLVGIMSYVQYKEENQVFCDIPIYGYYAKDEKVGTMLFQELASQLVSSGKYQFSMHVY